MPTFDPANAVTTVLQTAGYGTLGTDLFLGPVRPKSPQVPLRSVFVVATPGGPGADGVYGNPHKLRAAAVQVRIRHDQYAAGVLKAQQIYDSLATTTPATYLILRMGQSGPLWIGQNESGEYEWSVNVEAQYEKT